MEVPAAKYWRTPGKKKEEEEEDKKRPYEVIPLILPPPPPQVDAVMTTKDLVSFEVLDVEMLEEEGGGGGRGGGGESSSSAQGRGGGGGKWKLAEVEVIKTSDFGVRDVSYRVLTHLGPWLQAGDTVLGYDLKNATSLGGREEELKGRWVFGWVVHSYYHSLIHSSTHPPTHPPTFLQQGCGTTLRISFL